MRGSKKSAKAQKIMDEKQTKEYRTFCFSSSLRASIRTFAQGNSLGHHGGLVDSLPQPGLPRPVEYFNIKGMKARSCACVIFSTGVGIPSMMRGGSSNSVGSS